MNISPTTGLISWTPEEPQKGNHSITVHVEDGNGGTDDLTFILNVALGYVDRKQPGSSSSPVGQEGVSFVGTSIGFKGAVGIFTAISNASDRRRGRF